MPSKRPAPGSAYKAPELPRPHGPGHAWSKDEVLALAGARLKSGRNFENGKRAFAAARCVVCHRFGGDGGATGPDLTQAAGRFGVKDLVEAIVEPSRVVSDQYRASIIATDSGTIVTGRVVNESADSLIVVTDPEDSSKVAEIPRKSIEAIKPSTVSLMPEKLLAPLNEDEVLDLLAYLLSRGDATDAMFRSREKKEKRTRAHLASRPGSDAFKNAVARSRLQFTHHVFRPDPRVELLGGQKPQLKRRLAERDSLLVGMLGDLGRVVVADVRVECRHQHQRALQEFVDPFAVRLDALRSCR